MTPLERFFVLAAHWASYCHLLLLMSIKGGALFYPPTPNGQAPCRFSFALKTFSLATPSTWASPSETLAFRGLTLLLAW